VGSSIENGRTLGVNLPNAKATIAVPLHQYISISKENLDVKRLGRGDIATGTYPTKIQSMR